MRPGTLLLLVLVGIGAWGVFETVRMRNQPKDPVAEMRSLYAQFPSGYGAAYNVRKTDSLVNPIIGTITFTASEIEREMTFHWVGEKWNFSRMINTANGLDITGWGGGLELMMRPDIRQFLASAGWQPSQEQESEYQASVVKLKNVIAAPTPAPPGSWMWERNRGNPLDKPAR